ncbi:UNVERIFIED_CONTAM: hypothetical protein K2H54_058538 [Gekko kuhli]
MAYDPDVAYEADSTVAFGTKMHKYQYCSALKWKEEAISTFCSNGLVKQLQRMLQDINSYIKDLKTSMDMVPVKYEA